MPLERDTETLLKPERQTPGTLAELVLKPRWLTLWLLTVDLLDMIPEEGKAEESVRGWRVELRGADL